MTYVQSPTLSSHDKLNDVSQRLQAVETQNMDPTLEYRLGEDSGLENSGPMDSGNCQQSPSSQVQTNSPRSRIPLSSTTVIREDTPQPSLPQKENKLDNPVLKGSNFANELYIQQPSPGSSQILKSTPQNSKTRNKLLAYLRLKTPKVTDVQLPSPLSSSSSSTRNCVGIHYRVGKKISERTFSIIFEGINLLNNQRVAIKFVRLVYSY
jgi:hypothetical protein